MPNEYETKLQEWKDRHGIGHMRETNQDELLMAAEESQAKGKSWCFGCDKHMPICEMKLITKTLDPYTQCDQGEGDYIAKENRVRMCPTCFEEHYGHNAGTQRPGPNETHDCNSDAMAGFAEVTGYAAYEHTQNPM